MRHLEVSLLGMDDKDQKSLTVGDILDQLVKPSIIQGQPKEIYSRPIPPPVSTVPPSSNQISQQVQSGGLKLPQLGQQDKKQDLSQASLPSRPTGLKLTIRTMADDLARIKQGKLPSGLDIQRTITPSSKPGMPVTPPPPPKIERPLPSITPPSNISPGNTRQPVLPEISKIPKIGTPFFGRKPSMPPILPPLPPSARPPHIHEETRIADKDNLPLFPGAPVLKIRPKSPEEKVEYGVIAKIVSSGMVTGVLGTILVAVLAYFLIATFLFNDDGLIASPTPIPTSGLPIGRVNELESIFRNVSVVTFSISEGAEETIPELKLFIEKESLEAREFKRLSFRITTPEIKEKPTFTELFNALGINYPAELNNWIENNNTTFLYGHEEGFDSSNPDELHKRVVFIVEVKDITRTTEIVRGWESTIATDLKDIFDLDPSKQATATFLDNVYQGTNIRYKNFPFPDKSIDYAVVTSLTGRHYLILTNSRESMYSPADKIKGL